MERINKDIGVLEPFCEVLDKKNITNCFYYSNTNFEKEHRLFIDVSRLSSVNREILYTIADVFTDCFSFTDVLFDDKSLFCNYSGSNKRDRFKNHNFVCFSLPDFGDVFSDYMKGFFLELANSFVAQEPILAVKDVFTVDDMMRYSNYCKEGREDYKDFSFLVSLGINHPFRKVYGARTASHVCFSNGNVVERNGFVANGITKLFTLTPDRALDNFKKYNLEKQKEEVIKQKAKGSSNG